MQHLISSLKDGTPLVYAWFEAMHTRIDLMLWDRGVGEDIILELIRDIREDVLRIERMGSCFMTDSELSAVNRSPVGTPVEISEELYSILSRCIEHNKATEGLFDIAVSRNSPGLRLDEKILLEAGNKVMRLKEEVYINLSAYLKGYALDRAVAKVRNAHVANGLISFGNSSIAAFGNHPNGEGWPVAAAQGDENEYIICDMFLTSSGNETEDRIHIINPLTGEPVIGKGMVSVMSGTAEEGEVLSTVTFIKNNETKTT